ncbi:MAG: hypothetical protein ACLQAT_11775 [Candidatus Binataceae bacterium]
MDNSKLKIKIGNHEFEAEGPTEVIQAQFAAFKEMIAAAPQPARAPDVPNGDKGQPDGQGSPNHESLRIDKIMRQEGRIVSLTANTDSPENAVLLVLLGQKVFRNNDGVTGAEVVDGLRVSGQTITRLDRVTEKLAAEGQVIVVGVHRAKRYRLTNQGLNRAREIARTVIANVA